MGAVETVTFAELSVALLAALVFVPALTLAVVVLLVVVVLLLLLVLVLAGGRRRRRVVVVVVLAPPLLLLTAPVLPPVLTLALTEAVAGLVVRNAPRTPSSSSCARALMETPAKSAIRRGKTKILKRMG
jgi:hypothetical protein